MRKMPLHNLSPCVFLKGRNNILAVALSHTPVLSGVTSHTLFPPLLQGKQVLSHVSIASVILTLLCGSSDAASPLPVAIPQVPF